MKTGNTILGLVGGLAIGAVIGILFAPDKGSKTRKKIADKSNDLSSTVKDSVTSFASNVQDQYKNLKSEVTHAKDELVEEGMNNIENLSKKLVR